MKLYKTIVILFYALSLSFAQTDTPEDQKLKQEHLENMKILFEKTLDKI